MQSDLACIRPLSLKEAVEQLSSPGARAYAGGTDLLGCLQEGILDVEKIVSLSRLEDLRGIHKTADGGLRIGALSVIGMLAINSAIRTAYTALAQAAGQISSPQLKRWGTIGGNLCQKPRCWYYRQKFSCLRQGGDTCYAVAGENRYHCIFGSAGTCHMVHPSDTAPALIALGARVWIAGPLGFRSVALEEFFVPPEEDVQRETVLAAGEIVTAIVLPPPLANSVSSYRKVHVRSTGDFTLAGVALALQFEDDRIHAARVVLSGAAPVPWRSASAEEALVGEKLTAQIAVAAGAAAVRHATPLDQNAYKIDLFKGLIQDQLLAHRR
jgi:xanthine dehydrogenase YagS FAD-binding subunit